MTGEGRIFLRMRRLGGAIALIRRRNLDAPVRNGEICQHSTEKFQGRLGLIKRDHVSGVVYSREAEVAVLPRRAVLHAIDYEWRVPGCVKLG